jgi:hypothetical protein
MAAVLACGPGALLSHRSAAALHELLPSARTNVDVTVSTRRRARARITLHHTRKLDPVDGITKDGIPVTAVARTLFDLAYVVLPRQLERAFEEADRRDLLDLNALGRLTEGNRGRRSLRALLRTYAPDPAFTRSELERRFLRLCRDAGLPLPLTNTFVAGYEVDALWPEQRLIVEVDGYQFHSTRAAFERDRARDAVLRLAGYDVVHVSHRQLEADPAVVVRLIASLLEASRQTVA